MSSSNLKATGPNVNAAVANGIPPPPFTLPYPENHEVITANVLKLCTLPKDPRTELLITQLVTHLHEFIKETSVTTEEWMATLQFLTRAGQICTPLRQEFILLSDVLGVSALIDALNNPAANGATESSVLGPFFTEDSPDVGFGESIASEGKGSYMYVEGQLRSTDGTPIPDATIETWETDHLGFYDTQYADRQEPDCRGRLKTDKDGRFGYRAVVPVPYPIPGDGPVGDLLKLVNRHNMRPSHLHLMVEAPGFRKLVTALYPEGDEWVPSDAVFGVKKSLVVQLKDVEDEAEARKRGFPEGTRSFKLLHRDIVMVGEAESKATFEREAAARAKALKTL